MNNKALYIGGFLLMVVAQWYFASNQMLVHENTLQKGQELKFRTAPIDPIDAFRGKYVVLNFADNVFETDDWTAYKFGGSYYVKFKIDSLGFAQISDVDDEAPDDTEVYVQARIQNSHPGKITLGFPFNRWYMEEFKAEPAEQFYRKSHAEDKQSAIALVRVKKGIAVLKDVQIEGITLARWVEEKRQVE